ncbi:14 kDa proline-rich protein DC2.15-like [Gastrolobium bilobum]|uniref:14 kDa proline-rich protein DC2.15-like n=1 Tax=Gastrolobium bilobum TaxID=150636 RepID=UPI002AAF89F5|nr:14 kDa proline-rich protein DC2.15-like [Gastrolobium bilobum]
MASNKLSAIILVLSLLAYSTFTEACGSCKPTPTPSSPSPTPKPTPPTPKPCPPPAPAQQHCPKDTLKLGVCADLLGLVNVIVGTPPSSKCCALIMGLADLEAALCLCTAIKANVLGINLNIPVTLSLILSACEKTVPPGFQCA